MPSHRRSSGLLILAVVVATTSVAVAGEIEVDGRLFHVPDGFTVQRVAGPPLVNRPICADFDDRGRLYVADSSGSNDSVQVQRDTRPHRIVRLEDTDGDGQFDRSQVFADQMMFPEGTLWHEGSLYVAAPPEIWKLTDTDDDGRADQRQVWFDGKTLTGCANDLHGPYLGPDGWIYWCKGAFAEQTYQRPDGSSWTTRASHIFRRRADGDVIEAVMTGGMDNPVEIAFTPGGERIFTTTFFQHPRDGRRDGLIHAVYGGVYGKDHGVLEGHARTGELMPPLAHLGAAAPCGLVRLQSDHLGSAFQDNLLTCSFNMHKVFRHELSPAGATFAADGSDFLVCDDLDFHPTDVFEDADGSVLVIDTGGWYKLCCPTSQLWKPDVMGAIYRVSRPDARQGDDPRGRKLDFEKASAHELIGWLGDSRHVVRERTVAELGKRGLEAMVALRQATGLESAVARRHAVWALTRIDAPAARQLVRQFLADQDDHVRQVALHSISLWRDGDALDQLQTLLSAPSPHLRRGAAEALGRIGNPVAVPALLAAAGQDTDRVLQHSLTYALIEINDPAATRKQLAGDNHPSRCVAWMALDQMPAAALRADDVLPWLSSNVEPCRETAWWLVHQHPDWSTELAGYFHRQLQRSEWTKDEQLQLQRRLASFVSTAAIQSEIAWALESDAVDKEAKIAALRAVTAGRISDLPDRWIEVFQRLLQSADASLLTEAVDALRSITPSQTYAQLAEGLVQLAGDSRQPDRLRLVALSAAGALASKTEGKNRRPQLSIDTDQLQWVCTFLAVDQPVESRNLALEILERLVLSDADCGVVAESAAVAGPLEWRRILALFTACKDPAVGQTIVRSLQTSDAASALTADQLQQSLSGFGDAVVKQAEPILEQLAKDTADKLQKLQAVLPLLEVADARRGQAVFHDTKAACAACHQVGYLGGQIGPDLTRIGRIRNERDLLESILLPSASFVRSYEPWTIVMLDGRVFNGVLRNETGTEIELALDAERTIRLPVDQIELRQPSSVSIMPAGLDQQLTPQQLADLVKFLQAAQ